MEVSGKLKNQKQKRKMLKNQFNRTDKLIIIDGKKKQDSMLFLQENIAEKRMIPLNDRKRILWNQARYMDKSVLGLHLLLCVLLLVSVAVMSHYGMSEENIILASMLLSGALGAVSIAEVSRIFFSGIAELSESCYFNVRQLVAFHLAVSGVINLAVLLIGIMTVGYRWRLGLLQAGLYLLVPFVVSECCCLRVLLTEVGRKDSYLLLMMTAFVMALFYLLRVSMPRLYQAAALGVWGVVFAVGLLLLGVQIKVLLRGIEKGEIVCMN